MAKDSKALAVPTSSALATAPAYIAQAIQEGNENVTGQDLTVPRLVLLQNLSPEVIKTNPKHVAGAEAGNLMNSLTKTLYQQVNLVNLFQNRSFPVFVKRTLGGGFRGNYATKEDAERFISASPEKDKLETIETVTHYCLLLDENKLYVGDIAIPMSVTKLGFSRSWNSMILMAQGPRYSKVWSLSSVSQTGPKGTWFNFTINKPSEWVSEEMLKFAKGKYEIFKDFKDVSNPEG